jgi:hypothetical protein
MKKISILLFVALTITLAGCKKTVDEVLIIGNWSVTNYYEDGVQKNTEFNTNFPNYKINFKADKSFIETYGSTTVIGSWKNYNDDEKIIQLTIPATSEVRIYDILDLRTKTATVKLRGTPAKTYDLQN